MIKHEDAIDSIKNVINKIVMVLLCGIVGLGTLGVLILCFITLIRDGMGIYLVLLGVFVSLVIIIALTDEIKW